MMLTSCGAGRLMERSMKFTDIIFMKHEEDLSLPVSFFMHVRQICAKKTKRGASCKFGSTFSENTTTSIDASMMFATLMRLLC